MLIFMCCISLHSIALETVNKQKKWQSVKKSYSVYRKTLRLNNRLIVSEIQNLPFVNVFLLFCSQIKFLF